MTVFWLEGCRRFCLVCSFTRMPTAFVLVLLACHETNRVNAVNTQSIRKAAEYQVNRARLSIEANKINIINSGEHVACPVYSLCTNPPSLVGDESTTISPWYTSDTPMHSPQCNESQTLIGVRPNNHDPSTGDLLTSETCPKFDENIGCGWDNSRTRAGMKLPEGIDTSSDEFKDATCFGYDLENVWTTTLYSNCNEDSECWNYDEVNGNMVFVDDNNGDFCDMERGICANTATPEVGSFAPDVVEAQYFGDQRTGTHTTIPAKYWDALGNGNCPGTYDPRFRPWYAGTASGPKDVVIVLDNSGSMDGTKLSIMKRAATTVLDTIRSDDYANVVMFNTVAQSYSNQLVPMTDTNKCLLENYIEEQIANGATNYENAFKLAFDIMNNSTQNNQISGCSAKILLFFTDGDITRGRNDMVQVIDELKNGADQSIDFKILTYAIGDNLNDAGLDLLKDIACNNDGIYYRIEDFSDDIASIMASYYQMFVALRSSESEDAWVVWMDHIDALTGYRVFSASLPIFDKNTTPHTLLGVAVAEVAAARIIDSNRSSWGVDVGIYDDFDSEMESMLETAKKCPTLDYSFDELEAIRASIVNADTCSSNKKKKDDDDHVLIVVLCACAAVLVVLTAIVTSLCCKRKIKKKSEGYGHQKPVHMHHARPGNAGYAPGAHVDSQRYDFNPNYRA